jgi:hypothetical protein
MLLLLVFQYRKKFFQNALRLYVFGNAIYHFGNEMLDFAKNCWNLLFAGGILLIECWIWPPARPIFPTVGAFRRFSPRYALVPLETPTPRTIFLNARAGRRKKGTNRNYVVA